MAHYGVGELTAPVILCELGDVARLSSSRKAVRSAGLDIGVHRSDRRSRAGKLTKQGSPQLRWALYESAQAATRPTSPDRADYLALKERGLTHPRASITIARKLARPVSTPCASSARERSSPSADPAPMPIRSATPTTSQMEPSLPVSSRGFCDTRPQAEIQQRTSGRRRSPRSDPSTITSPALRSSTQISPGIRGAIGPTPPRNHSPPDFREARVQISRSPYFCSLAVPDRGACRMAA
jgi:hypothetical protein